MLRVLKVSAAALVAIVVVAALAFVLIGRERSLELVLGPVEHETVAFASVDTAGRKNTYLICPRDLCRGTPDRLSPIFALSAPDLRDRWMSMIADQPRVEQITADGTMLQYDFVQRSELMRFPDTITVQFIPLDEGRSTLVVFSRSNYGRYDFGANQERIEMWLDNLPGMDN